MTENSASKKLPVALELQINEIEADVQELNKFVVSEDDDRVLNELISNYDKLDEQFQKEIQAYGIIADDEISKLIENAAQVDGTLEITISKDDFNAFLSVAPPEGEGKLITEQDILEELKRLNVKYGVNHDKIRDLIKMHEANRSAIEKECIAGGTLSEKGKNGEVRFLYEHNNVTHDSKANSTSQVEVLKGQLIAKLVPVTKGKTGTNVFGIEIQPEAVGSAGLMAGENVRMIKETGEFFATVDGVIQKERNALSVRNLFIVKEDVDITTGNVDFPGFLRIKGSIRSGFSVKAKDDIEVKGSIEGATVISQNGSINVSGGIAGMGRCYVSAGKNVEAKYIENGKVWAKCAVKVKEAILNSSIAAGEEVEAISGKGVIAGGKIKAGNSVNAKIFGNRAELHTSITLGISLPIQEKINIIEHKSAVLRQTIAKINDALEKIVGTSGKMDGLPEEVKRKITELRKKVLVLSYTEKKLLSEQNDMERQALSSGKGFLSALRTIYPNVFVSMGDAKFNSRYEYGRTALHYDPGAQEINIIK